MQRAHREVVRGPRPHAGHRHRAGDERVEVALESDSIRGERRREAVDRRRARRRQADRRDRRGRHSCDLGRGRERDAEPFPSVVPDAERGGEPAGKRGRAFDGYLLTEQRTNRGLERIDRTRQPQPGARGDERREQCIAPEHVRDHVGPRIHIEHPAHPRDERHQHR